MEKEIKQKVYSANDVLKAADIPSSLGMAQDELPDRYMSFEGQTRPKQNMKSINRYRIDDMYEAVDY